MHQSIRRQANWMIVKICTRFNGTCLKNMWSGWYLTGMNMINMRSNNCNPFNDAAPIYKNTPKSTGIGMWLNNGVKNTDTPIVRKIKMCVTRCSRTPKNCGFSPGAAHSDSNFNEFTWLILSTVAATNLHVRRSNEHSVKWNLDWNGKELLTMADRMSCKFVWELPAQTSPSDSRSLF